MKRSCDGCCVFQELLSRKDFPSDVEGSRRLIEEHTQLKKKVKDLPGQSDCSALVLLINSPPTPLLPLSSSPLLPLLLLLLLQVLKAPVEELDREGQRLLQCIRSSDGFSGRNCISGSADFQSLVPKVSPHSSDNRTRPTVLHQSSPWVDWKLHSLLSSRWPVCWTSSTPPGRTSTRCGTSGS